MTQPVSEQNQRTRKAAYGAVTNIIAKGSAILVNLVSVPLTVSYLGADQYGVWITISSLISLLSISDLGFTMSLTNTLSEANGNNDPALAQRLVSTAFWSLVMIAFALFLVGYWILPRLPFQAFFSMTASPRLIEEIRESLVIAVAFFCLSFPTSVVLSIYLGYQELHKGNRWIIGGNVFSLLALMSVVRVEGGLPLLTTGVMGSLTAVKLANLIYQILVEHPELKPRPSLVCPACLRRLWSLGAYYFVQQVGSIGMYHFQPILLSRFSGPSAAGAFSVTYRLLSLPQQFLTIVLFPLLGAYGEARARGDFPWICSMFRWSVAGSLLFSIAATIPLALLAHPLIGIWTRHAVIPDMTTVLWLSFLGIANGLAAPLAIFLQATEQARCIGLMTVANGAATFMLSLFLIGRFGTAGLAMAMTISMVLISIPIAVRQSRLGYLAGRKEH